MSGKAYYFFKSTTPNENMYKNCTILIFHYTCSDKMADYQLIFQIDESNQFPII